MASVFKPLMMLYFFVVTAYFLYRIVVGSDKQKEVLHAAAYMAGAEVYFRMTKALIFYESGKYMVILFLLMGMFYQGFKRNAFTYVFYFLLLLPGVYVAYLNLNFDAEFRKMILFNLSGPIALTISAVYCFNRTISFQRMLSVMDTMIYPLIAMTVYIYLYNPDVREVITSTVSTSATSGGFGPNQVATVLGLGVFLLYNRLLISYPNKLVHLIMMFFLAAMAYRALITFSRGGVITALVMCAFFTIIYYLSTSLKAKFKLTYKFIAVIGAAGAIWIYALLQTGGLIGNRYANEDALGREKEDVTTGRVDLLIADFEAFSENPIFGIGVGKVKSFYVERLNTELPSHNEIARMFSEHGTFGVIALLILMFAPWASIIAGRRNIYFIPFFIFWLLTIGHSSMRIAAPAFIYGLALLNISYGSAKKNRLSGQSALRQP